MARPHFPHRHLLGIDGLSPFDIEALLDLADDAVEVSRQIEKKKTDPARAHADQPLLRTLDAHAILVRDRRQAPRRRRHEHGGGLVLGEEGRDAGRHRDDAQRHAAGHHHRAPSRGRRRASARPKGRLLGGQCRRRRARASDAGTPRRAHHPPQQGPHRRPRRRHLRRHPAFARGALQYHPAAGARRARARRRALDAAADRHRAPRRRDRSSTCARA